MHLLQSGVDFSVIALCLGHESVTTTDRRGRSGNEGQGTGAAATTRHQDAPLSPTRRPDAIPSGTVTMDRPQRPLCLLELGPY